MATLWSGERRVSFRYRSPDRGWEDRTVVALSVNEEKGRLYLVGKCEWRNAERGFRLDNVASPILDCETGVKGTAEELFGRAAPAGFEWPQRRVAKSPRDLVRDYGEQLEALGWSVIVGEPEPEMNTHFQGSIQIGLYRHYKNGKRLKRPDVWVEFVPELFTFGINERGAEYESRKVNPRPWQLGFRSGRSKRYASFEDASGPFLEAARPQS